MTAEGVQAAARSTKQLTLQEAQMILGIESGATWEEIMKKYDHLFTANEKSGSFYLQSKVYRAKERLEQEYIESGKMPPREESASADESQQQRAESSGNR
jgi:mitochondrial import inner membrane translocase subunit TIM16